MNPHLGMIYGYARLRLPSPEDAEDTVQETMLAAWNGLGEFRGESSFLTWITGITRRKISDHYRRAYRKDNPAAKWVHDDEAEPPESEKTDEKLDVNNAVSILTAAEQELVFLIFSAQLTYNEISNLINLPVGTIKSRMSAIKSKLKTALEGRKSDD